MSEDDPKAILGDLETLRSLLVDDNDSKKRAAGGSAGAKSTGGADDSFKPRQDAPDDDMDVPVLEDVVDGALEVDESMLAVHGQLEASEGTHILDDKAIEALLSDDWKSAASDVLDSARLKIQDSQTEWTPVDTDELNQALKVRIDATVSDWIRTTVVKHMGELRSLLLTVVQDEVTQQIDATLNQTGDAPNHLPSRSKKDPTSNPTGTEDRG